jgi:hypothetical protein
MIERAKAAGRSVGGFLCTYLRETWAEEGFIGGGITILGTLFIAPLALLISAMIWAVTQVTDGWDWANNRLRGGRRFATEPWQQKREGKEP